jgi:hypothetical protein
MMTMGDKKEIAAEIATVCFWGVVVIILLTIAGVW